MLDEESAREYIPLQKKAELGRELFNAFRKLDLLQDLIEDEEITEIMINGTQNIFVERKGRITMTDKRFPSRSRLEDVIQQIVAGANRMVNESVPIADARLPDGSRVNVVLYPVALKRPGGDDPEISGRADHHAGPGPPRGAQARRRPPS